MIDRSLQWAGDDDSFDMCLWMLSEDSPASHGSDRGPKHHSSRIQHFYTVVHVIFRLWEWGRQRELWQSECMGTLQQLPAWNHAYLCEVQYSSSRLAVCVYLVLFTLLYYKLVINIIIVVVIITTIKTPVRVI